MKSHDFRSSVPLEIQQRIDACCQEFERAWQDDTDAPSIESHVARVAPADQAHLLRELLLLELNYRRDERCRSLSDSQLCDLHPRLMSAIAEQLKLLRDQRSGKDSVGCVTQALPASRSEFEPTIDHDPRSSSGSRGLHIRCPHCSNPVELLTDTPLDSITCRTCGSAFSLVDQGDQTREAPTLKRIGRFDLVARLGLGGFGTVWKARDNELDRTVAVKIPRKGQLAARGSRAIPPRGALGGSTSSPKHRAGPRSWPRRRHDLHCQRFRSWRVAFDWLSGATPQPGEIARLWRSSPMPCNMPTRRG